MQTAAESNLALMFISSFEGVAGVLPTVEKLELNRQISQALIQGMCRRQSLHALAERLIAVADHAYPLRQMEVVEQASGLLLCLPLPHEFKSIACYYKAICLKQRGQIDEARVLFERVAEKATSRYKARAILALGTLVSSCGDFQSGLSLFIEGGRAIMRAKEFDPLAAFYTQSGLAILKSIDGDHRRALADWEAMFPLVRAISMSFPPLYYNHLNSLAVELLEVGRIAEARNVSNIVLASPYASAYPEHRETSREIALRGRRASRSVVAINWQEMQHRDHGGFTRETPADVPDALPIDEQPNDSEHKLLLFRRRAFHSNQEPLYSHLEAKQSHLTFAQKRARVIDIAHNLNEVDLDRLLEFASSLGYTPEPARRPREINLEEKGTLEMLVSLWTSGDLNIEDQVAVMSALRDCDNRLRQKNLINAIISYMFRFTQERMESEHFWRKRVEARLPETD